MIALLALFGVAFAQDGGVDAHGRALVPSDGDPLDPLWGYRAERQLAGSFGGEATLEWAKAPLVRVWQEGDTTTREPLLDNVFGVALGGQYALHERVAVGLSAPLWVLSTGIDGSNGVSLGDLRVSVPVGLVIPSETGEGLGVAVVPQLDLPTGRATAWLGNGGLAAGGVLTASFGTGALFFAGDVGVMSASHVTVDNGVGGTHVQADVSAAYLLNNATALRVEGRFDPSLASNDVAFAGTPAELGFNVRHRAGEEGLALMGGTSMGLTRGAGAAQYRLFAGVSYTGAKSWIKDSDGDGLMDPDDSCPLAPETVNSWKDTDGCPDELAAIEIKVVSPDGPVAGATVRSGDKVLGTTDANGMLTLRELMPETSLSLVGSGTLLLDNSAVAVTLHEGSQSATLELTPVPGTLVVRAIDAKTKAPLSGTLQFNAAGAPAESTFGTDGAKIEVKRGKWSVFVGAEGYRLVPMEAVIQSGETTTLQVELHRSLVKMQAEEIQILQQVNFAKASADILPVSDELLSEVATVLIANPQIHKVEVQGHTDSDGNDAYNLDLSQRRVDSVVEFLVNKGVERERLLAKGYGETKPMVPNTTKANKAQNRRVQFIIVEQERKVIEVPADQAPATVTPTP